MANSRERSEPPMPETTTIDVTAMQERLAALQARMAAACQRVGRPPDAVKLVAVSKTFPLEAIGAAHALGLRDFGENKVQELVQKAVAVPGALHGGDRRWHMIGHLQRNKARDVVAHADLFHALDSLRLARRLDTLAADAGRVVPCLLQVNVSGESSKSGVAPADVQGLLTELAAFQHVQIDGLMTLAAPAPDPELVRPQFRLLRQLLETYTATADRPLTVLSMGMSGDFEVAIEEGATHVRVGSALFGPRTYT